MKIIRCPRCYGTGVEPTVITSVQNDCQLCFGSGSVRVSRRPTGGFIAFAVLVAVLFCGVSPVRAQLMEQSRETWFRGRIPQISETLVAAKLREAMAYTTREMPACFQHQPIGQPFTVLYAKHTQLNGEPRPTNANRDNPWNRPGGLHDVDRQWADECSFLWNPPNPRGTTKGGIWPVIIWKAPLQKSRSVNMPAPNGWHWRFPANAIVFDQHLKKFSDGSWLPYEMRARLREINNWDVELYGPTESFDSLAKTTPNLESASKVRWVNLRTHGGRSFDRRAGLVVLPPIPNAKDILTSSIFKAVTASEWLASTHFHMTADDNDNLIPRGYAAALLGNEREACRSCHQDTLKSVDEFDAGRDWYDYVAGCDGIFKFHPFAPSCIGQANGDDRPVRLNKKLLDAGIIAIYDPAIHTKDIYGPAEGYNNGPWTPLNGNTRTLGPTTNVGETSLQRAAELAE